MMMPQPAVTVPYAEIAEALPQAACDGDSITAIEIRRFPPSSESAAERALEVTSEAVGLEHTPTDAHIIRAYIRLKAGGRCLERDRIESERLLRAQPFVASASVTAHEVGPGRVLVRVFVVDEWPYVVGAGFRGGSITSARLGSQNVQGRGLTAIVNVENGRAFRTGAGIRLEQYGLLGRPAFAGFTAERRPLGGTLEFEVAEPFLTDAQWFAVQAGATEETRFLHLVRPVGRDAAVESQRRNYDASFVARLHAPRRNRLIGLGGLAFLREEARTGGGSVIITDSGLVATNDGELDGRFPEYVATRVGAIVGFRMLDFITVSRFSALRAAQDVGRGIEASVLLAPSLTATDDRHDLLMSGDLYGGFGTAGSFVTVRLGGEGRRDREGDGWRGVATGARIDWYRLPTPTRTRILTLSSAAVHSPIVPSQLTLRERDAGLIGFVGSGEAGGRRVVLRYESRVLQPWWRSRVDVAIATFVDAGRTWRGDVPYGTTSPVRSSVGFSLLGSPRFGKRVYRLDIAFPVNPGPGDGRIAFRIGSSDRTGTAWMQSRAVLRSRVGAGPATLSRW